ncbi:MAG: manganese efflux pump [Alicyclobacillaceae bacterium]|nr:manganese efflux pump [Alicyclobacillaceae bacterium]
MAWLNLLLIGIGTNLDNMGIGLAYGLRGTKIRHVHNALINLIGVFFALAGTFFGAALGLRVDVRTAHVASSAILCTLGILTMLQGVWRTRNRDMGDTRAYPVTGARTTTWREAWMLGFALSITNAVAGTGAGLSGSDIGPTVASIGIWGYLVIWIGNILATKKGAALFGNYRGVAAGLLLILIGLRQSLS